MTEFWLNVFVNTCIFMCGYCWARYQMATAALLAPGAPPVPKEKK